MYTCTHTLTHRYSALREALLRDAAEQVPCPALLWDSCLIICVIFLCIIPVYSVVQMRLIYTTQEDSLTNKHTHR